MSFSPDFVPVYANALAKDVTAKAADDYVITLKDGIKFSNGNDVTADDVVYSFERMIDPDLVGVRRVRTCARWLEQAGITKVDDRTVQLKLKQAVVQLQRGAVRLRLRNRAGRLRALRR